MGLQLDLRDLVIEVFHSSPNQYPKDACRKTCCVTHHQTSTHTHNQTKTPSQHDIFELSNVEYVTSNAKSSHLGIKMIMKERSPTMRHVSRTHRVALDCLFDRINLDPKIQIKYLDTKHQLADMLTEENFTRDEWNNLLHVFNISHFSFICCSQIFSSTSCLETMAKRMQEQNGEERVVPY